MKIIIALIIVHLVISTLKADAALTLLDLTFLLIMIGLDYGN